MQDLIDRAKYVAQFKVGNMVMIAMRSGNELREVEIISITDNEIMICSGDFRQDTFHVDISITPPRIL